MKKDLIFAPILLVVAIALCMLKITHMPMHIAISVVGVLILIAYTVLTKKEWKLPALEVIMRVFYGTAFITGALLMKLHGVAVLAALHKISAISFAILLIVLFVHKLAVYKRK